MVVGDSLAAALGDSVMRCPRGHRIPDGDQNCKRIPPSSRAPEVDGMVERSSSTGCVKSPARMGRDRWKSALTP